MTTTQTTNSSNSFFAANDWAAASFREKYGKSLFSEDQKRLQQYRDADIALVNTHVLQQLDEIDMAAKDEDASELTGGRRARSARTVAESFKPGMGSELRFAVPVRV